MNRNMRRQMVVILSLLVLVTSVVPAAHAATCSTAPIAGSWGLTLTGTLILPTGPVPVAAVVNGTIDLQGNASGTEGRTLGGGYADETFSGNLTVNADCSGTATLRFYDEGGQLVRISLLTLVIDDHYQQMRMVQKSLTLPDGTQLPVVVTVEGRKR